jgi:hypothetical protein
MLLLSSLLRDENDGTTTGIAFCLSKKRSQDERSWIPVMFFLLFASTVRSEDVFSTNHHV